MAVLVVDDLLKTDLVLLCRKYDLLTSGTKASVLIRLNDKFKSINAQMDASFRSYIIEESSLDELRKQYNSRAVEPEQTTSNQIETELLDQVVFSENREESPSTRLSRPSSSRQDTSSDETRLHTQRNLMKEASCIKEVRDRTSQTFERFFAEMKKVGEFFRWTDWMKMEITKLKIDEDYLAEVQFDAAGTFHDAQTALEEHFGLTYTKIVKKLDEFHRLPAESAVTAFQRLRKLLVKPAYAFDGLPQKHKEVTIIKQIKRIILGGNFMNFQMAWNAAGKPTNLTVVATIVLDFEEMGGTGTVPIVNQLENDDEMECYQLRTGRCFRCNQEGHFARDCKEGKTEKKSNSMEEMYKKLIEENKRMQEQMEANFLKRFQHLANTIQVQPRNNNPERIRCHNCNQEGHIARYCSKPRERYRGCNRCRQQQKPYHWDSECPSFKQK